MIDNYTRLVNLFSKDTQNPLFSKQRLEALSKSKIFEINDEVTFLLEKTDNDEAERPFPFPIMFLNVNFTFEELPIIGIQFEEKESEQIADANTKLIYSVITLFYHEYEGQTRLVKNIPIKYDIKNKLENLFTGENQVYFERKYGQKVRILANNFLDFLNNPDVEFVEVIRTEDQNAKRMNRGQLPIPNYTNIKLTGQLKIYVNKLQPQGLYKIGHQFWVRGHWRTLRNEERYGLNSGQKIWILPYKKGEGILIEKRYEVKPKSILPSS